MIKKCLLLNFKMLLRKANAIDTPNILGLIDRYKHVFYDDYTVLSPELVLQQVVSGNVWVFEDKQRIKGVISFTNQFFDLHASICCVVHPSALKSALKLKLFEQVIEEAYAVLGIKKIIALVFQHQECAKKLLIKHNFRFVGVKDMHTRKGGRYMDIIEYELKQKRWKNFKRQQEGS